MPLSSGILNNVLKTFLAKLDVARGLLHGDSLSILKVMIVLEITLFGLWWAMSGGEMLGKLLKRVMAIGFFSYILNNYPTFLAEIIGGFKQTSYNAAGFYFVDFFENPSGVIDMGLVIIKPLLALLAEKVGYISGWIDGLLIIITIVVTTLAFAILAIQIVITRIEFAIVTTLGLILIPFGVFKHTSFLAEKIFGAIISFGVKVMVLSFIVLISFPIMMTLGFQGDNASSFFHQVYVMVGSFTVAALAIHAPGIAAGLLSGSPSLSAASIAAPIAAGAAMAGGSISSGVKAVAAAAAGPAGAGLKMAGGLAKGAAGAVTSGLGGGAGEAGALASGGGSPLGGGFSGGGASQGVSGGSATTESGSAGPGSPLKTAAMGGESSNSFIKDSESRFNSNRGFEDQSSSESAFRSSGERQESDATKASKADKDQKPGSGDLKEGKKDNQDTSNKNSNGDNQSSDSQKTEEIQKQVEDNLSGKQGAFKQAARVLGNAATAYSVANTMLSSSSPNGSMQAPIQREGEE